MHLWPKMQNKVRTFCIREPQNEFLAKVALYRIKWEKKQLINIPTLFITQKYIYY